LPWAFLLCFLPFLLLHIQTCSLCLSDSSSKKILQYQKS
jgi:hypothetical protein